MITDAKVMILKKEDLPNDGNVFDFEGRFYQDLDVSFIWVDMPPGGSVRLHRHAYQEIFILLEGRAAFTVGSDTLEAHAGQVIIVPANTPHKFKNAAGQNLKQVDIHTSRQFITEWLE